MTALRKARSLRKTTKKCMDKVSRRRNTALRIRLALNYLNREVSQIIQALCSESEKERLTHIRVKNKACLFWHQPAQTATTCWATKNWRCKRRMMSAHLMDPWKVCWATTRDSFSIHLSRSKRWTLSQAMLIMKQATFMHTSPPLQQLHTSLMMLLRSSR